MNRISNITNSIRNYLMSGIAGYSWSRKLLNAAYFRMTPLQRSHFHQEFSKIFKFRSIRGRSGSWEVGFLDRLIHIPLSSEQFWLDWDTALSVVGQDNEIRETYAALINSADRPDLFIDIGANYGTHSLLFLVHQIRTISFEPNPACHAIFKRLCAANKVIPCLEPVALGDRRGRVSLSYPKEDTWLGSTDPEVAEKLAQSRELVTENVEQKTLDDYLKQIGHCRTLIKIDTEGHELSVLEGAKRTIEEIRPLIIFECWNDIQRSDLFNYLESINYQICHLPWNPTDQVQKLSREQFLSSSAVNFIAVPFR